MSCGGPSCLCSPPQLAAQLLSAAITLSCLVTFPHSCVAGLCRTSAVSCLAAPDKCIIPPAGETVQQVFSRVSVARDELDGPQVDDQGLTQTDSRNIAVADQYINAIPTDVSQACLPVLPVCRSCNQSLHCMSSSEAGHVDCTWQLLMLEDQVPVVQGSLLTAPSWLCCRSAA